jgi:hypothetical protein
LKFMEEKGDKRVVGEPIPSLGIGRQGNNTSIVGVVFSFSSLP